jgi:SAM-dependent methyltransferase
MKQFVTGKPGEDERAAMLLTPAEKEIVNQINTFLKGKPSEDQSPSILNIGAGKSVSVEKQLSDLKCRCIYDRIDVDDCTVDFPNTRHCWRGSVEDMSAVSSNIYIAAFANYVLEHVPDLNKAAGEVHRILRPSGIFSISVPNTMAPEFILARHTPLWFHKMIRGSEAWEIHYSYKDIPHLIEIFTTHGFILHDVKYCSFTEGYLWRFPVLNVVSKLYDWIVGKSRIKQLMGNVCVTFRKPA